jgi:hypothetical protein
MEQDKGVEHMELVVHIQNVTLAFEPENAGIISKPKHSAT